MRLKKELEALLFSSGKKMSVEELSQITKDDPGNISAALKGLKERYEAEESSLMLCEEEPGSWKLSVKDNFVPLVSEIVTQTELSRTLMETLAVIAWKAPVLQSNVIKIRTNKAYDHLSELENLGYITREKSGRTRLIKLSQKFFEYFDVPKEKLKEMFNDFDKIESLISEKEQEAQILKKKVQKMKEEEEKEKLEEQQVMDGNIDLEQVEKQAMNRGDSSLPQHPGGMDDGKNCQEQAGKAQRMGQLEIVDEQEDSKEKLGELDIVDEKPKASGIMTDNGRTLEDAMEKNSSEEQGEAGLKAEKDAVKDGSAEGDKKAEKKDASGDKAKAEENGLEEKKTTEDAGEEGDDAAEDSFAKAGGKAEEKGSEEKKGGGKENSIDDGKDSKDTAEEKKEGK